MRPFSKRLDKDNPLKIANESFRPPETKSRLAAKSQAGRGSTLCFLCVLAAVSAINFSFSSYGYSLYFSCLMVFSVLLTHFLRKSLESLVLWLLAA